MCSHYFRQDIAVLPALMTAKGILSGKVTTKVTFSFSLYKYTDTIMNDKFPYNVVGCKTPLLLSFCFYKYCFLQNLICIVNQFKIRV